jgi:hypothetical protein
LEQIENISSDCNEDDPINGNGQSMSSDNIQGPKKGVNANPSNGFELVELQTVETDTRREKVIPLYDPDDAVVNVFLIHSSLKSALALAPFAQGFQQQVNFNGK